MMIAKKELSTLRCLSACGTADRLVSHGAIARGVYR
jgi:hypothetical protein